MLYVFAIFAKKKKYISAAVKMALSLHFNFPYAILPLGWGGIGKAVGIFKIWLRAVELGICHFNYYLEICFGNVPLNK